MMHPFLKLVVPAVDGYSPVSDSFPKAKRDMLAGRGAAQKRSCDARQRAVPAVPVVSGE